MVLESLDTSKRAEKKPWQLLFIGFLYASAALFVSSWLFKRLESMIMIFFTVLASAPLVYYIFKYEEKKISFVEGERSLLQEHKKAISVFLCLFIGFTIAFSLWYLVLPREMAESIFSEQIQTIEGINKGATGNFFNDAGIFGTIFINNLRVLIFCMIFSFLYGIGGIFILAWNASVIGTALGDFIRLRLSDVAASVGLVQVAAYFKVVSLGIVRYAIHGLPEIAAYFVAGLAGSIISVAVINHDLTTKNFQKILLDSSDLIVISLLILFFASLIEVYVTPLFF